MSISNIDVSGYLHSHEAYRIPDGVAGKNMPDQKTAHSPHLQEKDHKVLTKNAGKVQETEETYEVVDDTKMMVVFRNMMKGNNVTSAEENKLMQYDDKMYRAAKIGQTMSQMQKSRVEDRASEWDEKKEKEYREKLEQLRTEFEDVISGLTKKLYDFSDEQKWNAMEIHEEKTGYEGLDATGSAGAAIGNAVDLSI